MTVTARPCRCDRPVPVEGDCMKCGRPLSAPVIYRPRSDMIEDERKARMAAHKARQRERRKRVK